MSSFHKVNVAATVVGHWGNGALNGGDLALVLSASAHGHALVPGTDVLCVKWEVELVGQKRSIASMYLTW
jgi:hypothetical protein